MSALSSLCKEIETKAFLVTKREENTRSHPEHGRKDSLRWKYLEGHLKENENLSDGKFSF